jgi:uncharacterized protein YbcI
MWRRIWFVADLVGPTRVEVSEGEAARGRSLLTRISNEVVGAFKEYYGKGPVSAKSYFLDDLLFVVMRGGLTPPEVFLLEQGEHDVVRQYRQTFENHMAEILSKKIEELTRRKVVNFQSQVLFDPDMSIEIFVFEKRAPDEVIVATALGEIQDEPMGEARDEESETAPGRDAAPGQEAVRRLDQA